MLLLLKEGSWGKKKWSCWVKKRKTSEWWNKYVNNKVPETDWEENFQISGSSFKEIYKKLKLYLQKNPTRIRPPVSKETQVSSFLYYISDEGQ